MTLDINVSPAKKSPKQWFAIRVVDSKPAQYLHSWSAYGYTPRFNVKYEPRIQNLAACRRSINMMANLAVADEAVATFEIVRLDVTPSDVVLRPGGTTTVDVPQTRYEIRQVAVQAPPKKEKKVQW